MIIYNTKSDLLEKKKNVKYLDVMQNILSLNIKIKMLP